MSEFQYYWFEAIDRVLTPQQQQELRDISSRAKITSRSFENEYHFGDFKGKPIELMKKYFDAHIYYACWATRVFMLKVPVKCIDLKLAKRYCTEHTFKIVEHGDDLIFCFKISIEDGNGDWEEEEDAKQMISLRDSIMAGDYRSLYLAWLANRHDDHRRKNDDPPRPPVPAGLGKPTEPLKMFADFMFLEDDDLEEAAKLSSDDVPKPQTLKEIKDWVTNLPDKDRQKILVDLLQEKTAAQTIQRELKNRFIQDRKKADKPIKKPCRKKS